MSELPKAYEPKETDARWGDFWEKHRFFVADPTSEKPAYSIVIPPPNVTGVLHMGHALVNSLQDFLIRWKRMCGYEVLWVPGTDHAGIATQSVVERHLMATEGKRRKDYSREAFLKEIWAWKEAHEGRILDQLKKLGCSCDWSRLRFTMDEGCNHAVRRVFKELYDEGLIYRGDYLVNWDPLAQTALSDDEVEYEERESFLWYFKYPLTDGGGFVHIATTRPETMLGDTAVAVHPKDARYAHLIGKTVRLPILEREIPVIADHHIDPEFGTGVVKITPAHDPNDYRMGLEHGLPMINIMAPDGSINEQGGPFHGMPREKAREEVVAHMQALGLVEKIERYTHRVGVSYRSKAVIEPYLSKQWFMKMEPFVEPLKSAVASGEVKVLPKSWEHTYFHWIDNLRDWCLSRQLWWGHRIPIWYRKDDPSEMICYEGEGEPPEVTREPEKWKQDPDVLDTWFSSALWPFSALGFPEETPELERFYPTSVLVTGHDILFFWVARMILMGKKIRGKVPFPETFLHGLIFGRSYWRTDKEGAITYVTGDERREYDLGKAIPKGITSKWEKISKSKGNVIDPLEMIETYGTDAVRMTLCACANQSPQIDLDLRRFEEFKNFANKVWNGARFVLLQLTSETLPEDLGELSLEDRWILSRLNQTAKIMNHVFATYNFETAAHTAYTFFWKEFCAYYVEITKRKEGKEKMLVVVLCAALRLLHPIAPFITEELFQRLKERFPKLPKGAGDPYTADLMAALGSPACALAPYPQAIEEEIHPEVEDAFAFLDSIVYAVRNIRGEMKIPPGMKTELYLVGSHPALEGNEGIIEALVKVSVLHLVAKAPKLPFAATAAVGNLQIIVPLPAELAEKEQERLEKEKGRLEEQCGRLQKQLANPQFVERAAPALVEKTRHSLEQIQHELTAIGSKLGNL